MHPKTCAGDLPRAGADRRYHLCGMLALSLWAAGCAMTDAKFPVVVGASITKSDLVPCSDYGSATNYAGGPYYIRDPETGRVARRHEGIDFCTAPGAEVLAAATGTVVQLVREDPHRGGRVTIRTRIRYPDGAITQTLFVDALHIKPREDLRVGDDVVAGQVIGHTEPPGKLQIGSRSHVHLSAGPGPWTWITHTDPNRFWQKGAGIVTCFDAGNPPTDTQIVAPVRC